MWTGPFSGLIFEQKIPSPEATTYLHNNTTPETAVHRRRQPDTHVHCGKDWECRLPLVESVVFTRTKVRGDDGVREGGPCPVEKKSRTVHVGKKTKSI